MHFSASSIGTAIDTPNHRKRVHRALALQTTSQKRVVNKCSHEQNCVRLLWCCWSLCLLLATFLFICFFLHFFIGSQYSKCFHSNHLAWIHLLFFFRDQRRSFQNTGIHMKLCCKCLKNAQFEKLFLYAWIRSLVHNRTVQELRQNWMGHWKRFERSVLIYNITRHARFGCLRPKNVQRSSLVMLGTAHHVASPPSIPQPFHGGPHHIQMNRRAWRKWIRWRFSYVCDVRAYTFWEGDSTKRVRFIRCDAGARSRASPWMRCGQCMASNG